MAGARLGMKGAACLLGLAAMFLVFCEPAEDSVHWLRDVLLTKAFGAAAAWAAWILVEKSHDNNQKRETRL